jgi:mRNA interferase YafQ
MRISTTERFERRLVRFIKAHPELISKVQKTMNDLSADPFTPYLKTHKLTGSLKECHACRVTYEYRVIFILDKDSLCFIDIGSHDEVYN